MAAMIFFFYRNHTFTVTLTISHTVHSQRKLDVFDTVLSVYVALTVLYWVKLTLTQGSFQ